MAKKGRRSKEPTKEERKKVQDLLAVGAAIKDIAIALDRSVPNLRKHFPQEIFSGKKLPPKKVPPFRITKAMREKVQRYIGCKMTAVDVARVIGCTPEQLEEFFPEEMAIGHAVTRAKVIDHLHEQMADGVVGATNRLESMTVIPDPEAPPSGASPGYVGKKVVARSEAKAAVQAGGRFTPRPPPKLIVDNS